MTEFKRVWDASDKEYDFYDATTTYGTFSSLTGGDMNISMISYNVVGSNGGVTTKFLPGQISYAPIKMSCAMSDVLSDLTDWFYDTVEGKVGDIYRNCSIAQYQKKDGKQLVIWELINAVPIALPGFSYNSYQKSSSTTFKVMIQAEEILITYP